MANIFLWDIETGINDRAKDYFAKKRYDPPKNYKDEAKIAEAIIRLRHDDEDKAALHWWTGKILCIGAKSLDQPANSFVFAGPDEKEILCLFFDRLAKEGQVQLIGKSGDVFDRPFVIGRAMANDTGIPSALRPYRAVEDIDHIFGFSARCNQTGKLNDYAQGLGIDGKTGHGGDVKGIYDEARLGNSDAWTKIANYCLNDVHITYEILRRWQKDYTPRGQTKEAPRIAKIDPELEIPFGPSATTVEAIEAPASTFHGMEF